MSTPTDPYSRPDHEDAHDDILDPLPEPAGEPGTAASQVRPESDELGGSDAAVEPEDQATDQSPRLDDPILPPVDSETESTQSWKPDFSDDDKEVSAANTESERERWERAFGSAESSTDDATIVTPQRSADETLIAPPAPVSPAASENAYPTRTSVFQRTGDAGQPTYVSTPPEPLQRNPEQRFTHKFEEPIPEEPRGRGWAHVGVFFATLLLAPLAWYLLADSGVRLSGLEDSAWNTGTVDWLVVLELLGALLCLAVLWYLVSLSSVGAIVFGLIITVAGAVAIFAPTVVQDVLQSSPIQQFVSYNDFTGNVGHHLTDDLASGRLTGFGFLLFMTGIVSHQARRHGQERGEILGRRGVLLSRRTDA